MENVDSTYSVDSEERNNFFESKKLRKRAEEDATLLSNRISLLKQEEAKAWKKIEETRKRAKEIEDARKRHEQEKRLKQVEKHKAPKTYTKETNILQETKLKKLALKGVVKLFNEINQRQKSESNKKTEIKRIKQSERFKKRMRRAGEESQARKIVKYEVEPPKWNVLRDDFKV